MSENSLPIIVAFDGSDDSIRAVHWAVDLAERNGRELQADIVALDPDQVAPQMKEYEAEFATSAAAMARDIVKHSRLVDPTVNILHGWVLETLHRRAKDASLMVVGSRGHGILENHWLGSVSHHLAGHAPCDVAVVRPAHNSGSRQIIVGIDGSPASARALEFACEHAQATGMHVLAVHAYQSAMLNTTGLAVLPEDIDTTHIEAAERAAEQYAAAAVQKYPDVELRSTAVIGRPARVLSRLSDDAALVVVGSRGHNTFTELLLGSVAQETLRRAECPVVVVR